MESTSLAVIPGSRLPEMLGKFQLDNHHVEEWSDPSQEPGHKHRARKEVGKWVNLEQNADIHYQKQEDSKHSDRSQERSRTEVIQGKAPDSSFQVVRSHRQYQDGDERSGSTMQQTSSTSYHVSSGRSVRSTTKTTSNKTTTKTVTVSGGGGGGRADDFENLRMSFTPLDTSTQRERISVSRSGTMGIRRPPTRRHTPAALLCSSPEDGPEAQRPDEGQILVDSDDNLRDTPDPEIGKMGEQSGMSIVGFKNISPKIRVGFPVEIQLELQTKLRSSSTLERDSHHHHHHHLHLDENLMRDGPELDFEQITNKLTDSNKDPVVRETVLPIQIGGISSSANSSRDSSFDLKERKKRSSLLSENFESSSGGGGPLTTVEGQNGSSVFANSFRSSLHQFSSRLRDNEEEHSGLGGGGGVGDINGTNGRRMSWDLLQKMQEIRQQNEQNGKLYSTMSSGTSSGAEDYIPSHHHGNIVDEDDDDVGVEVEVDVDDDDEYGRNRRNSFTQRLRTINNNTINEDKKSVITLNTSRESLINFQRQNSYESGEKEKKRNSGLEIEEIVENTNDLQSYHHLHHYHHHNHLNQDNQLISTPDVLHHDNSNSNSLSPSLERSRKLLKMLDETPDLINKMSFRSYFSNSASEKQESKDWDDGDSEKDDQMDWETQRQLSFLNDSLSRILDESRSIDSLNFKGESKINAENYQNGHSTLNTNATSGLGEEEPADILDLNGNLKDIGGSKTIQVSQTWISSVDHKPVQTARDNDVVTSISATNDAYKKGTKRVEFCKTEVHFTPDSGRFNIVETDENKPSTAHLFRRKKRSERKSQKEQQQQQQSSSFSSSSSMSSLESTTTTTTTTDKCDTAYIVEMEVGGNNNGGGVDKHKEHKESKKIQKKEENKSTIQIKEVAPNQDHDQHSSLPMLATSIGELSKSDSEKFATQYDRRHSEGRTSRVFINLESLSNKNGSHHHPGNNHSDEYEDEIRSPSHMILSNYGEMKIQRYLKQLKTPNSREGSSSPLGSPTPPPQHPDDDDENLDEDHFRFDNILYENGSFVPLATRRSLIEMNNRNRKRQNASASQSSDHSSTTSTYSLPTSDKDQYSTLRMGSMEAIVTTSGSRPQITSVDFRYNNDNGSGGEQPPSEDDSEKLDKMTSDIEYHNLSVRERRERFSSVPSPVMPNIYGTTKNGKNGHFRHSSVISPMDSQASEMSNTRPSSSTYLSKKPPTPILPVQFASFEKQGAELRGRFYAKTNGNGNMSSTPDHHPTFHNDPSTTATLSSVKKGDSKSKSIVTIGNYNESSSSSHEHVDESNSQEMIVTTTTMEESLEKDDSVTEPVLSLDHTWKGPAHYESHQQENSTSQNSKALAAGARSLTFPKSLRGAEPEWVSKAKSRETRVTDWSLIEKQQTSTTNSRNTEPPWISEIRFRNKPTPNEELKSLPKISVVYPWQRDNSSSSSSKEPSEDREERPPEESHIVSIIPEPALNGTISRDDKRFGSYDLYSGKSLPPIKSLKSVPEVSVPASRKKNISNKSIVEVHSEPEHYISSPQKYYNNVQTKKKDVSMDGFEMATYSNKSSSTLSSSSKKASSRRGTADMESTHAVTHNNETKQEVETLPKKSRRPLQVTQQNKERSPRSGDREVHSEGQGRGQKHSEEKYKTQPKPPKPPTRGTSLPREETGNNRDDHRGTMMVSVPPTYRESSRHSQQKERSSDVTSSGTTTSHHATATVKKSGNRRKAPEMSHYETTASPVSPKPQRDPSNQPVHHRHPTIQITKLPMRTAKVSVVDGKRVAGSNTGGRENKPKTNKHHVNAPIRGETSKTRQEPSSLATSIGGKGHSHQNATSCPLSRDQAGRRAPSSSNNLQDSSTIRGKPRRAGQQTPLKTSTRSPSLELETKKRKTNIGGEQEHPKGIVKRK